MEQNTQWIISILTLWYELCRTNFLYTQKFLKYILSKYEIIVGHKYGQKVLLHGFYIFLIEDPQICSYYYPTSSDQVFIYNLRFYLLRIQTPTNPHLGFLFLPLAWLSTKYNTIYILWEIYCPTAFSKTFPVHSQYERPTPWINWNFPQIVFYWVIYIRCNWHQPPNVTAAVCIICESKCYH